MSVHSSGDVSKAFVLNKCLAIYELCSDSSFEVELQTQDISLLESVLSKRHGICPAGLLSEELSTHLFGFNFCCLYKGFFCHFIIISIFLLHKPDE